VFKADVVLGEGRSSGVRGGDVAELGELQPTSSCRRRVGYLPLDEGGGNHRVAEDLALLLEAAVGGGVVAAGASLRASG